MKRSPTRQSYAQNDKKLLKYAKMDFQTACYGSLFSEISDTERIFEKSAYQTASEKCGKQNFEAKI